MRISGDRTSWHHRFRDFLEYGPIFAGRMLDVSWTHAGRMSDSAGSAHGSQIAWNDWPCSPSSPTRNLGAPHGYAYRPPIAPSPVVELTGSQAQPNDGSTVSSNHGNKRSLKSMAQGWQ
jgi:hypothetical protein